MTKIDKDLITHKVIIVTGKKERTIAMETLLRKLGCDVIIVFSLYDALKFIVQEMPHMVITESELPDGTATSLYDRLEAHEILRRTPIVVTVLKKTREILQELSKRKFAGFFLGKVEPKIFLKKSLEILMNPLIPSPYYTDFESLGAKVDFNLSFSGKVIGKTEDHLVVKSSMEVDSQAALVCVPEDGRFAPLLVRQGSNLYDEEGDGILNLYPIGKISGKGRAWLPRIPDYATKSSDPGRRIILFYDPSEERFSQFEEILSGYDIKAMHAASLKRALMFLKQRGSSFGAIYLYELMNDASSIEWRKAFESMEGSDRPPVLVGTTSINLKDTPSIKYIRRPFGLGLFIESIQACFERADDLATHAAQAGFVGVDVKFQAPAKLLGVDEIGGVLQVKFPVVSGAKIEIQHPIMSQINPDSNSVKIINVKKIEDVANTWQVRFSMVDAVGSKSKHYERVSKVIQMVERSKMDEDADNALELGENLQVS